MNSFMFDDKPDPMPNGGWGDLMVLLIALIFTICATQCT